MVAKELDRFLEELAIGVGIVAAWLVIVVLFLLCLSQTLSRCHPRNRTMSPGSVWLVLIPVFGLLWQFIVVGRVGESLSREYRARGLRSHGDFGTYLGVVCCVLGLVCFVPILIVEFVFGAAGLVYFIIYWVKIAGYSAELARDGRPVALKFDEDEYADEYDDRPRRRAD